MPGSNSEEQLAQLSTNIMEIDRSIPPILQNSSVRSRVLLGSRAPFQAADQATSIAMRDDPVDFLVHTRLRATRVKAHPQTSQQ